jgi:uncharacterized membrane protein YphA (DoxX/SURF4 family)
MRTNPFLDTFLFLIGRTPDHQNSGVGPLLTVLFLVLLIASLVIARRNWLIDSAQRTYEHLVRWFMRVMIGCMWFQGSLWKLPLPVSGGLKFWTEEEGRYAAFEVHKWFATNVMVPGLPVLNSLVYLTELSLAVSFMLGLFVRPMAIVGILFTLQLWLGLYQHPNEWPWEYMFLCFTMGFFFIDRAGMSLGLDALLAKRAPTADDGPLLRFYRRFA